MASATSVVTDAVRSLRGRIWGGRPVAPTDTAEKKHHVETFDRLRAYVDHYAIDPTPANYALLYRHYVSGEANLADDVARLIETGFAPDDHSGESLSEEDLQAIANSAQDQLSALERLVSSSHDDARGFGDALEGKAKSMSRGRAGDAMVANLIELTRAMIVKTRAAEQELRTRGEAMSSLQASLLDARTKADTDALTGLSNRRAFERMLGAAIERARHSHRHLSLAICDVDHFKLINDRFGHVTGDRVLKLISDILNAHCAGQGHVFRFGGEEFVILFEELEADAAYELVDSARRDLADRNIVKKETGEPLGKITLSAGIGGMPPADDASNLLRIADRALYAAKANGRNCTIEAERSVTLG